MITTFPIPGEVFPHSGTLDPNCTNTSFVSFASEICHCSFCPSACRTPGIFLRLDKLTLKLLNFPITGERRQGKARQGKARQGMQGKAIRQGRQGKAGKAKQGKARQGKARQGRRDKTIKTRQDKARQGKAGEARRGKENELEREGTGKQR